LFTKIFLLIEQLQYFTHFIIYKLKVGGGAKNLLQNNKAKIIFKQVIFYTFYYIQIKRLGAKNLIQIHKAKIIFKQVIFYTFYHIQIKRLGANNLLQDNEAKFSK